MMTMIGYAFTVHGRDGQIVLEQGLYDLAYSWRQRVIKAMLVIGHQLESTDDVLLVEWSEIDRHVSPEGLTVIIIINSLISHFILPHDCLC
jgi:hypothetical protein